MNRLHCFCGSVRIIVLHMNKLRFNFKLIIVYSKKKLYFFVKLRLIVTSKTEKNKIAYSFVNMRYIWKKKVWSKKNVCYKLAVNSFMNTCGNWRIIAVSFIVEKIQCMNRWIEIEELHWIELEMDFFPNNNWLLDALNLKFLKKYYFSWIIILILVYSCAEHV